MRVVTSASHETVRTAERLEAEICELASHLAAATCRFLLLLAEFDQLAGWVGHRSCAHWLSWRCGLSGAAAREHVRVAHALGEFTVIREAFAAGRLSYSKVRAITRVATGRNEAELVQTALATTAAQLERIVRAMRRATRDQVRERHQRRSLAWWWDDDGTMVLRVRLDPDEGAVVLAALRAARTLHPHPDTGDGIPGRAGEPIHEPVAVSPGLSSGSTPDRTPGTVPDAPDGAPDTPDEAPRGTPDRAAGVAGARGGDDPAPACAARGRRKAHPAGRGSAAHASAEAQSGARQRADHPSIPLVDAFAAVMTSYLSSAARDAADPEAFQVVVVTEALGAETTPGRPPSAARRRDSPSADAGRTGSGSGPGPAAAGRRGGAAERAGRPVDAGQYGTPVDPVDVQSDGPAADSVAAARVGAVVDPAGSGRNDSAAGPAGSGRATTSASAGQSASRSSFASPAGVTDDGIPLPRDTVLRIACGSAVVQATVGADGVPIDLGRKTRRVNGSLRRALRLRDAAACRFPGCTARRRLHAHHITHWSEGGPTTLTNLILLCPAHHWAVHEGGHCVSVDETGRLFFTRPDGRPVPYAPRLGPADGGLVTRDDEITPGTMPPWDGAPLDLDYAVVALLQPALGGPPPTSGRPAA